MSVFVLKDKLKEIFEIDQNLVKIKETDMIECKSAFSLANKYVYAKIFAALANNKGGCILFGIDDKSGSIIGLKNDQFANFDAVEMTKALTSSFVPIINWDREIIITDQKKNIGVLYIYEAKNKPVICKKNVRKIKEGEIYFRYPGQTRRIMYSEMVEIIHKERNKLVDLFFEKIEKIKTIGTSDSGILDFKKGDIHGNQATMIIDEKLLSEIQFIEDSSLSEKNGKPIMKLVGEVKPVSVVTKTVLQPISTFTIVSSFLNRTIPDGIDPTEFIIQIGSESSQNYPVYFFIKKADVKLGQVIRTIEESLPGNYKKLRLLDRLKGKTRDPQKFKLNLGTKASNERKEFLESVLKEEISFRDLTDHLKIKHLFEGLTNITRIQLTQKADFLFPLLLELFKHNYRGSVSSEFRNLICLLDILLYR